MKGKSKSMRLLSLRKFWTILYPMILRNFIFKLELHRWLWSRPEIDQQIIKAYMEGANQIEIAARLRKGLKFIRSTLMAGKNSLIKYIHDNDLRGLFEK